MQAMEMRTWSVLAGVVLMLAGCSTPGTDQDARSGAGGMGSSRAAESQSVTLLNVSYDPTRELYQAINTSFRAYWRGKTGQDVTIRMSHGGSGRQARSVIDGLEADVVTLGLAFDIDSISQAGLVDPGWQKRLPHNSVPFTSTIVFLVKKGNPKGIHNWPDLVRPGTAVITPNPKTSGGARWIYLAAYGYALRHNHYSDTAARDFITRFYRNVPVLDTGARGSTITFTQRGIGDVLVGWENEAMLAARQTSRGQYEIVYPPESILAEPPVSVVDRFVEKHSTRDVANAYLQFLYTSEGQRIGAMNFYRPTIPNLPATETALFPRITLFTVDQVFGGWARAQKIHFASGGVFDQIHAPAHSAA